MHGLAAAGGPGRLLGIEPGGGAEPGDGCRGTGRLDLPVHFHLGLSETPVSLQCSVWCLETKRRMLPISELPVSRLSAWVCVCMRVARRWVCEHPERACLSRGCACTCVITHSLCGCIVHQVAGSSTDYNVLNTGTECSDVQSGRTGLAWDTRCPGQKPLCLPRVRDLCLRGGLCPCVSSALRRRDMLPGTHVQLFLELKSDLHQGFVVGN